MSFNKQQEHIKVPFAALSAFVDPSVRFGLQFDRKDKAAGPEKVVTAPTPLPAPEKKPPLVTQSDGEAKPEAGSAAASEQAPKPDDASKVVKLDSFRKK